MNSAYCELVYRPIEKCSLCIVIRIVICTHLAAFIVHCDVHCIFIYKEFFIVHSLHYQLYDGRKGQQFQTLFFGHTEK